MESDRYQQNHKLYILGIINLLMSMGLFAFSLYLLPFLLLKWVYRVPEFILNWKQWLEMVYQFSDLAASLSIFLFFFFLAIITAIIADYASNRIDNQIYGIEPKKTSEVRSEKIKEDVKETASVLSKIIVLVILVLIGIAVMQWLLYVPPV